MKAGKVRDDVTAAVYDRRVMGCLDGACGRIDWTEVTSFDGTRPTAARLHGRYAWESSNACADGHPIGGKLNGYLWLTCANGDALCQTQLMGELVKAGTDAPLYFGGRFYDTDHQQAIQPAILYAEGTLGVPVPLAAASLGATPMNSAVCPTAFALPVAPGPTPDAGIGVTPSDDGCAMAHGSDPIAVLLVAALLVHRARRRR